MNLIIFRDIRVPLLMRIGERRRRLDDTSERATEQKAEIVESLAVVSIDLAPTVLDMAGIHIPQEMDGVSLLKTIQKQKNYSHYYYQ